MGSQNRLKNNHTELTDNSIYNCFSNSPDVISFTLGLPMDLQGLKPIPRKTGKPSRKAERPKRRKAGGPEFRKAKPRVQCAYLNQPVCGSCHDTGRNELARTSHVLFSLFSSQSFAFAGHRNDSLEPGYAKFRAPKPDNPPGVRFGRRCEASTHKPTTPTKSLISLNALAYTQADARARGRMLEYGGPISSDYPVFFNNIWLFWWSECNW